MVPETRRVLTLLLSGGRTQNRDLSFSVLAEIGRYIGQSFSPRSRYYVFTLGDPRPFLKDLTHVIREAVRRCLVSWHRRVHLPQPRRARARP
jgi:hypothetical protein